MTAWDQQVAGSHYKDLPIQPAEFLQVNNVPWLEANVMKYVMRWRDKIGVEDVRKARHYLDMLMETTCGTGSTEDKN